MQCNLLSDKTLHQEMKNWRRDLHTHPETAYEEQRTAKIVAGLLKSFSLDVHTGIAVTGVVATLKGNLTGDHCIALRADMDALNLKEENTFSHCSKTQGKMHGCGHDGHTAMLLGAAKYLSEHRDFAGTVLFIFQPAEEGEAGAKRMLDEGIFEKFQVDAIFGMHNWPGLSVGHFAVHNGPVMASVDMFDIIIEGCGGHAAMPQQCIDPILVCSHLVTAIQSITSREIDPMSPSVLSITKIRGGDAYNVIPHKVTLSGSCRTLDQAVRDQIEASLRHKIDKVCAAFGAKGTLSYKKRFPATINNPKMATFSKATAMEVAGEDAVVTHLKPSMASEDFAYFLEKKPGTFVWIGNGPTHKGCALHSPHYDFNDDALLVGASYWVQLVNDSNGLPNL